MPSARKLRTRLVSTAAVFALALVSLSLSPVGVAYATTKPLPIATAEAGVVNAINTLRIQQPAHVEALASNGFVDEYARAYANAYAACNGCANPTVAEPADIILLPEWSDLHPVLTRFTGTTTSTLTRFEAAVATIPGSDGSQGSFDDKYGSVAMVSKAGRIYEAVLFVQATSILGRITAPRPTITGTPAVGRTLTAHTGATSPAETTIGFTWERSDGTIVVRDSNTYVPTAADIGFRFFVFDVITKDGYEPVNEFSKGTAKVIRGTIVPGKVTIFGHANLSLPGFPVQELTALRGIWSPLSPNFTYQWYANGRAIKGATAQTYDLPTTGSIKGRRISVRVFASQAGYRSASRLSASTAPVGLPLIPVTSQPVVGSKGDPVIGSTVDVGNDHAWGPGTIHLSYKWLVNGKVVPRATKTSFVVPASAFAKVNGNISVIETGTARGFAPTSLRSAPDFVVPIDFENNGTAVVNSTTPGHTIGVHVSGLVPVARAYHFQWYKDGVPVLRATKSTLVTATQNGHTYFVRVTASRLGYIPNVFDSNTVLVNRLDFVQGFATVIPVTPGHTLSAHIHGFSPTPTSYTFQWLRGDMAIPHATKSTLVTSKTVGFNYTLLVTAHRAGYNPITIQSNTVTVDNE